MAEAVVGACAALLVAFGVACLGAWAYGYGYDSGFEAGERAGKALGGSGGEGRGWVE